MKTRIFGAIFILVLAISQCTEKANAEIDDPINVVSIGDSYTSGNGALDYYDWNCYKSINAYVHQYEQLLENNSFDVKSTNLGCFGAKNKDIPWEISQGIGALNSADLVFVTIGGNDGGFSSLVIDCLSLARIVKQCHDNVENANNDFPNIVSDTKSSIEQLAQVAPNAKIVLIGYPYLVANCHGDANLIRSLQSYADGEYRLLVHSLNSSGDTKGRIHYLSLIQPFSGGEVCGDGPQLIRGTLDTWVSMFKEWWHPNVEGHAVIADELYQMNLHKDLQTTPIVHKPTPQPPPSESFAYSNLPLSCGVNVAHASTYIQTSLNGQVFSHGEAIDMPISIGTKVVSPENGTISIGWDEYGYGRYIDVVASSGKVHRMAHLQKEVSVSSGQKVIKGELLGYVGITGASSGPHLHYEQRVSGNQIAVSLSGPALIWGNPNSVGDKYTTHGLESANCGTSKHDEVKIHLGDGDIRRINHQNGDSWTIWNHISNPKFFVECDVDNDGEDEVYSAEYRSSRWYVMQGTVGRARSNLAWRQYSADFGTRNITSMSCGDRDGNGKDEVKLRLSDGTIRRLDNSGNSWIIWKGMGAAVSWVECDADSDGRDELYSLELKSNGGYRLMRGRFYSNGKPWSWGLYVSHSVLSGVHVNAMSCGDRDGNGEDELKLHIDSGKIVRVSTQPKIADRKLWTLWSGISKPITMVECDVNSDGKDELYSLEYRSSKHYIMQGMIKPSKSWKQFSTDFDGLAVNAMSCGDRDNA